MNALTTESPSVSSEDVTLYYREGSSDKIYQARLEPAGELFLVNFAYGRRGSTLNTGTKTRAPIDYPTAKAIFDKLIREKTAKGYTPGADGTPYQDTDKAGRFTGILPQLLNPVDENEVLRLMEDNGWWMQEKYDGRHMLIQKTPDEIIAINRKGLIIGLPTTLMESVRLIPGVFILDGESVGESFYAFDLLELNGQNLRPASYKTRLLALLTIMVGTQHPQIYSVATAYDVDQKQTMLRRLREAHREGVVMKRSDAPYVPGHPASGGPQLKHKFYATLSAVVSQVNAQRSVELRLIGKDGWQCAGNVTIPANQPIPKVGTVVEVRYLYAYRESGSLYQPIYLGPRSDVEPHECMASQLKFKSNEEDEH